MKETTLATVIIALYNAEPYLRRCLDSLRSQTLRDFDVIVVDDGSTDRSLAIAQEYAHRDERFRVFHKENGGVGSARQYGIERLAEQGGKYSIHVDPDDWVEPQMLERMVGKAEETGADMVICDYWQDLKDRQILHRQNPKSEKPQRVLGALFRGLHGGLWNKLTRSDCYKKADIKFPEGMNYCEDFYVNVCLLRRSVRKVAYLAEAFYHYDNYSNPQAETRQQNKDYTCKKCMEIVKRCRDQVPYAERNWEFRKFEIWHAFGILSDGSVNDDEFKAFFNELPFTLLLHRECRRPYVLTVLIAARTPVSCRYALILFRRYQAIGRKLRLGRA